MAKKTTVSVKVLASSYPYHGHTYLKNEVIEMDPHDLSGPIERKQVKIKEPKTAEKKKGPDSNRATGPSENREG